MNFAPYFLPVVLALILLILMKLQANASRKALHAAEERVQALEQQLASRETDEGSQDLKQLLVNTENDLREELRKTEERMQALEQQPASRETGEGSQDLKQLLVNTENDLREELRKTEERMQALEQQLASRETGEGSQDLNREPSETVNSIREEIVKISEEKDLKIVQLQEDLRSALDSFMRATGKKLEESEAAAKARGEEVIEKVTTLLRQAVRKPEKKKEEEPPPARPAVSPMHEKAKRLARLIVSDIVLYNQAAVEEGVKNGTFTDVMAHEIQEAKKLYASRIPEEIRSKTNYLDDAFAALIEQKKRELNIS